MLNFIGQFIHRARPLIYKVGLRPKQGSVWFSPSLHLHYAFVKGLEAARKRIKK